jgi:hypothetical protein
VKLTMDGRAYTAPLTVQMDPRVKTSPAGLQQQFECERQLARIMTRTTEALRQARAVQEQIAKLGHDAKGPLAEHLAALGKKIQDPALVKMNSQASRLYSDIDSADVAPTAAQRAALAKITQDHPGVMEGWTKLKAEIDAINSELKAANLPQIDLNLKPAQTDDGDDSDVG